MEYINNNNVIRTDHFYIAAIIENILQLEETNEIILPEKPLFSITDKGDYISLENKRFLIKIKNQALSWNSMIIINKNLNQQNHIGECSLIASNHDALFTGSSKMIKINHIPYLIIADTPSEFIDNYRQVTKTEEELIIHECSWKSLKNTYQQLIDKLSCGANIKKIKTGFTCGYEHQELIERFSFLTSLPHASNALYPVYINAQLSKNIIAVNESSIALLISKKESIALEKFVLPAGVWYHKSLGSRHENYIHINATFPPLLIKGGSIEWRGEECIIYPGDNCYKNDDVSIDLTFTKTSGMIHINSNKDIRLIFPPIIDADIKGVRPIFRNEGMILRLTAGKHEISITKIKYFRAAPSLIEKALQLPGDIASKQLCNQILSGEANDPSLVMLKAPWNKLIKDFYKKK